MENKSKLALNKTTLQDLELGAVSGGAMLRGAAIDNEVRRKSAHVGVETCEIRSRGCPMRDVI